jgi:hypothetical protein
MQGRRDHARLTTHAERLPVTVFDDRDETAVTAQPPDSRGWDRSGIFELAATFRRPVSRHDFVNVDRNEVPVTGSQRRGARREKRLCQQGERVGLACGQAVQGSVLLARRFT